MGKPTKGNQKGAQNHAEGQHGEKTLSRLQDITNDEGRQRETHSQRAANDPNRTEEGTAELHERLIHEGSDGGHRLVEGRKQHDEADRNSDRNRLEIDEERHKHSHLKPPGSAGK